MAKNTVNAYSCNGTALFGDRYNVWLNKFVCCQEKNYVKGDLVIVDFSTKD